MTTAVTVHYAIDKSSSSFTVRAFATGMLSSFGHNPTLAIRSFEGEVEFSPEALSAASLRLNVKADSLEVTDDIKSKDRQEMESTMRLKGKIAVIYGAGGAIGGSL